MPVFARVPLRHTENLKEKDSEEQEQDDPKAEQTQNRRKTRSEARYQYQTWLDAEGSYSHCGFEQFVETVSSLNQFEGNTGDEEFLQLLDGKPTASCANHQCSCQTAHGYEDIKQVPPVSTITVPTEAIKSYNDIDEVDRCDHKEKVILK